MSLGFGEIIILILALLGAIAIGLTVVIVVLRAWSRGRDDRERHARLFDEMRRRGR